MRFDIITIFPYMFRGIFSGGVIKKALERGLLEVHVHNLRKFALGKHKQVDDRPFGGGEGMVFKPEPIFKAVESVVVCEKAEVILLSARGEKFDYRLAEKLSQKKQVVLICGRYEGVDERVADFLVTREISVGEYILSGGEPAAVAVVDAVSRFIPGVVGQKEAVRNDSYFQERLDFPQYTRPREFRSIKVPEILISGDHQQIARWRKKKALEKTWRMRPDLLERKKLTPEEKRLLDEFIKERKEP